MVASVKQEGAISSPPVDATGAARAMLERAFPQAGQQAQVEQTSAQGVAQNTAAPVVNGQPVYSDIALADYMAKRAAQQKFGDATRSDAETQRTGVTKAEVQPESANTTTAIPEENVVASSDIDSIIKEKQLDLDVSLFEELDKIGVKYTKENVILIRRSPMGEILWLETGNDLAGLQHILAHKFDFKARGISDIPNFLDKLLKTVPEKTGQSVKGLFADYLIDGHRYRIAYGTNGFIVTCYPID